MIEDEMRKDYGFVWDVHVGFHAVESSESFSELENIPVSSFESLRLQQ